MEEKLELKQLCSDLQQKIKEISDKKSKLAGDMHQMQNQLVQLDARRMRHNETLRSGEQVKLELEHTKSIARMDVQDLSVFKSMVKQRSAEEDDLI